MILESEMDKARDQQGIVGTEFHKQQQQHNSRPSSSMSNKSAPDVSYKLIIISIQNKTIVEISTEVGKSIWYKI